MSHYTIHHASPTPAEHIHLRTVSGLTPPPAHRVEHALKNSVHTVIARAHTSPSAEDDTGQVVGMCRCIGDGAVFIQIVDMAVDPAHQRQGLGGKLLDAMLEWIDNNAPDAYLSLIGDAPGQKLYTSKGFRMTSGKGMVRSKWGG